MQKKDLKLKLKRNVQKITAQKLRAACCVILLVLRLGFGDLEFYMPTEVATARRAAPSPGKRQTPCLLSLQSYHPASISISDSSFQFPLWFK